MDVNLINPLLEAIRDVMPQLGFNQVERSKLTIGERELSGKGVTIIVGLSEGANGNVAYNMTRDAACRIASTMMMGAPVPELDEMAKSAISELGNMLTANAATQLSNKGLSVNISSPSLIIGSDFRVKISSTKYLNMELTIDSISLELLIAIET